MHYSWLISSIKDRRRDLELTQESLAELAGIGLRTLKKFENGNGNPTLQTLCKILDVLGLQLRLEPKETRADQLAFKATAAKDNRRESEI